MGVPNRFESRQHSLENPVVNSQSMPNRKPRLISGIYLAAWFGIFPGLAEALIFAGKKIFLAYFRFFNPDSIWMAPLGYVIFFSIIGAGVSLLTNKLSRDIWLRLVTFMYSFLSYASILLICSKLHKLAILVLALGLAYQTSRMIASHEDRFYKIVDSSLGWLSFLRDLLFARKRTKNRMNNSITCLPNPGSYLLSTSLLIFGLALSVRGSMYVERRRSISGPLPQ